MIMWELAVCVVVAMLGMEDGYVTCDNVGVS